MRVAIFHNYMDNIGGAEKLVLMLAKELNADIYTTNISKSAINKLGFSTRNIYSIGNIPKKAPFRQQMAVWLFSRLKLKGYDKYIIAGDWAFSAAHHHQCHWYVHSPARELWDLYRYTRKNSVPILLRPIFDIWVRYNRYLMQKYTKKIKTIVCNSKNTQKRIRKYLHRDAEIVYPPVDTKKYHYAQSKGYWLSVNRLIPHKRIELQIEAFRKMPDKKLIIVGSYEKGAPQFESYVRKIKSNLPKNIEIMHWVSEKELIKLYAQCEGVLCTSKDEDFGMTAIEAMASGKPVVAVNEGGYKETVSHGVSGVFIDPTPHGLINGIRSAQSQKFDHYAIQKYAQRFSTTLFARKIKQILNLQIK